MKHMLRKIATGIMSEHQGQGRDSIEHLVRALSETEGLKTALLEYGAEALIDQEIETPVCRVCWIGSADYTTGDGAMKRYRPCYKCALDPIESAKQDRVRECIEAEALTASTRDFTPVPRDLEAYVREMRRAFVAAGGTEETY